jgi:NitT/TauT family transport system permease protein
MNQYLKAFDYWPLVLLIGLWYMTWIVIDNPILVPNPWETALSLVDYSTDQKFLSSLGATLQNLIFSWLLVQLLVLITLVAINNRHAEHLVDHWGSMFQTMPTFALLPILIVIMGFGPSMLYTLIIFGNYWVASSYLITALKKVKLKWFAQANNLKWPILKQIRHIYFPALLPYLINIASITWGMCWRTLLAVEIMFGGLTSQMGLGALMMENRITYDTKEVWAILLLILIISLLVNSAFRLLQKKTFW